jgi:hypothetical protein
LFDVRIQTTDMVDGPSALAGLAHVRMPASYCLLDY